ncbi:MAG: hypothetical protein HKM06_04175 [Spirochaetales bacterium]|nr:hypothetical protein [Spirochaetales bacterium]
MNSFVTRVYTVLVLLGLAALVVWGVLDWQNKLQFNEEKSQAELAQASASLVQLEKSQGNLKVSDVSRVLKSELFVDPRWKLIELSSVSKGVEYYWGPPPPTPFPTRVQAAQYIAPPNWRANPATEKIAQVSFSFPGTLNYSLEGLYVFYGNDDLFNLLKILGFFLVGLMTLTSILLVLTTLFPEAKTAVNEPEPVPQDPPGENFNNLRSLEDLENLRDLDGAFADVPEVATFPKSPEPETWREHHLEEETPTPQAGEFEEPQTSGELSLALVTVSAENADPAVLTFALRNFFKDSAEVIEDHPSRWVVILKGKSLETALNLVGDFAHQRKDAGIFAGLSSRAGRTLTTKELFAEAERALLRARETQRPVVGLKIQSKNN